MVKSALFSVGAVLLMAVLAILMPISAMAETEKKPDEDYTPTTEIKTVDGKEYVIRVHEDGDLQNHGVEEDEEHVHARVFPLVNHKQHGDEKRTKFVYGPGFALVRGEESDTHSELELVKLPGFRLVDTESHDDGRFDNKFLKLPIFGSVFRHYRTDEKEKTRFLIFSHTKHLDENGDPLKRKEHQERRSRGKISR